MAVPGPDRIIGLGVDTGGTFTDAAVVDMTSRKVMARCKFPTSHDDLMRALHLSIDETIELSEVPASRIDIVSVSTTLATNAILEGKGGDVGLIGIGWRPQEGWALGARNQAFIRGGHDPNGRPVDALDLNEVKAAIDAVGEGADALAISGLFSVNNPSHENEIKRMAMERTGLPAVVGHDLTGELGIYERTVTAVLNARLIPSIVEFLDGTVGSLRARGVECPVMVAKGDGSLMSVEAARERPIETILSGPAASAVGGMFLSGERDCIVIDMGGTSTDIALLHNGRSGVSEEGTTIGGWRTRVQTTDMRTCAMGGDSEIYSEKHEVRIGPERAVPLCMASLEHPGLIDRLRSSGNYRFYRVSREAINGLSSGERAIHERLRSLGPQTLDELRVGLPEVLFVDDHLHSLIRRGLVVRLGFTPTDLLHVLGRYVKGDAAASEAALGMIAASLAKSKEVMADELLGRIVSNISEEVLKMALFGNARVDVDDSGYRRLMDLLTGARKAQVVDPRPVLDRPIIGVGAPAGAFIPLVGARLGARTVLPADHDVGNAVGAVTGKICEFAKVTVVPMNDRFHTYSPLGVPISHPTMDAALDSAKRIVSEIITRKAKASGANGNIEISIEMDEVKAIVGHPVAQEVISHIDVRGFGIAEPDLARRP